MINCLLLLYLRNSQLRFLISEAYLESLRLRQKEFDSSFQIIAARGYTFKNESDTFFYKLEKLLTSESINVTQVFYNYMEQVLDNVASNQFHRLNNHKYVYKQLN